MEHVPQGCYPLDEHKARVIMGDDAALALEWIMAYAMNFGSHSSKEDPDENVTANELITYGMININLPKDSYTEYLCKGGVLESESVDPLFWDKLALYMGIEIPKEKRENFFTCSC